MSQIRIQCKGCTEQNFYYLKASFADLRSRNGNGIDMSGDAAQPFIISICANCSLCVFHKSDSWSINKK